jgi:hypothetical protein
MHTGLLSVRSTLFIPVGSIYTEITLGGPSRNMVPDCSMGLLGTHSEAGLTTDAFIIVNPSDVAVFGVYVGRSGRTILDANRGDTLPADCYLNIIRKFSKGILDYLDTGKRQALDTIMGE